MKNSLFELSQSFFDNDQFINTDKYFEYASGIPGITYSKREALYCFHNWRGYNLGPLILNPRKIIDRVILIGHSDQATLPRESLPLMILGARKIFGVNVYPLGSIAFPIPLGLTNRTAESELHKVYGNHQHFARALDCSQTRSKYQGKLYANFSTWTNEKERSPLMSYLQTLNNVLIDEFQATNKSRIQYLRKLRSCDFVVCPQGNGIDTHRVWETLYMGGIPIVRRHPIMVELLKELPVFFVDEWSEISDQKILEEKWYEIQSGEYNFDKLNIRYWLEKIKSFVNPRRLNW